MTEPTSSRPGSSAAGYHASSIPPSPRPSVASRASRSSLRRDHDRNEALAHHHQPAPSALPQATRATDDDHAAQSPPPHTGPVPFRPLFALVTTSAHPSYRQTTQHPILHYVFADDDPELLTEALVQHHRAADELSGEYSRERAIMLDLAPTGHGPGYEVERASSLSPDWAVVSASIGRMEGINGSLAAAHGGQGALMLRIEGISVESSSSPPSGKTSTPEGELQGSGAKLPRPQQVAEEYSGLLSDFDKRMGVLRRVIDARGETQRPVTARGEEQSSAPLVRGKDELNEH